MYQVNRIMKIAPLAIFARQGNNSDKLCEYLTCKYILLNTRNPKCEIQKLMFDTNLRWTSGLGSSPKIAISPLRKPTLSCALSSPNLVPETQCGGGGGVHKCSNNSTVLSVKRIWLWQQKICVWRIRNEIWRRPWACEKSRKLFVFPKYWSNWWNSYRA